jgi:uncharacterized membrane protein YdjX (TVP38/TMEM64 family)
MLVNQPDRIDQDKVQPLPTSADNSAPRSPQAGATAGPRIRCPECGHDLSAAAQARGESGDARGKCAACGAEFEWYKLLAYPTPKRETLKQLGPTAVLGAIWAAAPAVLGFLLVGFLPQVAEAIEKLGIWALPTYTVLFIVSAGIGFLPTYGQSILGGWTFGFAMGFPAALAGFVGGSIIGYFIAKSVSRDRVQLVLEQNPKARAVRDALIGRGFWKTAGIVTLIRVPPNSPFALTNLVLASSGVRLAPYVIGTAIGMAPRTAIAVWIAAAAHVPGATNMKEVLEQREWWVWAIGIAAVVLVVAVLGWIGNRAVAKVTGVSANGG